MLRENAREAHVASEAVVKILKAGGAVMATFLVSNFNDVL